MPRSGVFRKSVGSGDLFFCCSRGSFWGIIFICCPFKDHCFFHKFSVLCLLSIRPCPNLSRRETTDVRERRPGGRPSRLPNPLAEFEWYGGLTSEQQAEYFQVLRREQVRRSWMGTTRREESGPPTPGAANHRNAEKRGGCKFLRDFFLHFFDFIEICSFFFLVGNF